MDPADALVLEAGDLGAVFSPQEIITALTKNAATFLGVGDSMGTIAVGYDADLVIIDGDPLSDIELLRNVVVVVKNGEIMVERDVSP
jgi:imidazolonepropionase-like amidohydrolase